MRLLTFAISYFWIHFSGVCLHPQSSSVRIDGNQSWEALQKALIAGNENEFRTLFETGLNVNATDENGNTALMLAAERGHQKNVEHLIQMGANVNTVSNRGRTALIAAAENGHEYIVRKLIEHSADVNAVDADNNTALAFSIRHDDKIMAELLVHNGANVAGHDGGEALIWAAKKGYRKFAQTLIEKGVNVNAADWYGVPALIPAVEYGYDDIVRLLVESGADINVSNRDSNYAFFLAIFRGVLTNVTHSEVAEFLLQRGANISAEQPRYYNILLNWAAQTGHDEIVELLIQKGVDINEVLFEQNSALAWAAVNGHEKIVRMLLERGAEVNVANQDDNSALIFSAHYGYESIIKLLAENGAEINAVNIFNHSALYSATEAGHEKAVRILIENRADVNASDENGNSPLHLAVQSKDRLNIARLLIESGAALNAVNKSGLTPLETAIDAGNELSVALLLEKGALIIDNAILLAASKGKAQIIRILFDYGARMNATNSNGDTALMLAIPTGDDLTLRMLVEFGADVNAVNGQNESALTIAVFKADVSYVMPYYLLNLGADPNVGRSYNDTALILAAERAGNNKMPGIYTRDRSYIEKFIEKGADVNASGDKGFTALMRLAQKLNVDSAQLLIENGASVNATNDAGNSALNIAASNNDAGMVDLLIQNRADVNNKGENGRTPLMMVAGQEPFKCTMLEKINKTFFIDHRQYIDCEIPDKVLQLLIENGANVNAVDNEQRTALDIALEASQTEGRKAAIRLLTQHGAERGDSLLYRKAASQACKLYSDITAQWNYAKAVSRVLKGTAAKRGEFPWMVALGYLRSRYRVKFSCGGSLISHKFVLTAAHCVKISDRPVVARLGKVTVSDENDFQTESQNIREIISHPGYLSSTKKNDIALIRLNDDLYITKHIQPVCIQTQLRDEPAQTNLTVTGWGITDNGKTSTELLKVDLKTMPLAECNAFYLKYFADRNLPAFQNGIDESQYCAHDPIGRADSCEGDSGGPLQTARTYSEPVKVVGVVSFALKCGNGLPGIYTRVAHYIEWIGSHVWPNGKIQTPRVFNGTDDDIDTDYDDFINTPLMEAISRKYDNTALQIIRDGTDINTVGYNGLTPLMKAAIIGNEEIARALIERGAGVHAKNDNGDSALILATLNNHLNISKWLIDNGTNINHKGAYDETPLMIAAGQGYVEILRLLIDKGAKLNMVDRNGRTALDAAFGAYESEDRKEVIRILIENGAERGAIVLYKKTASRACRLYSNLTGRWNYLIAGNASNGSVAEIGQFPWMVALGYLSSEYKVSYLCAGSLISDRFVLTAAHCVRDNLEPVVARLGIVTLTDDEDFRAENRNIQNMIPHPAYSASTKKNDIALIQLIGHLNFSKLIQPICIQNLLRDEPIKTTLVSTSWRQVNTSNIVRSELLKMDLKTMPLSQCNDSILSDSENRNSADFRSGIDESQYCVHDPVRGMGDRCIENDGGPLQTTQTHSDPVKVVGVASFGIGCTGPSVYTRVAHYIDWIGSHVWPNGDIRTPQVSIAANENNDSDMQIWETK